MSRALKIVVIQACMTSATPAFAQLTDKALLDTVRRLAATERRATTALLRSLIELEDRRLYGMERAVT